MRMCIIRMALMIVAILAIPAITFAKPGPVVFTFMERAEYHSDVKIPNAAANAPKFKDDTFIYSLVSAYRDLDKNVSANVFYLNKYGSDAEKTTSHIAGLSLTRKFSKKAKASYSFSFSSNPEDQLIGTPGTTNSLTLPLSSSERHTFGFDYTLNPNNKKGPRYTMKTSYGTASDFDSSRTLSGKLDADGRLTKKTTYNVSYQIVWGLTNRNQGDKTQFGNQYSVDLTYALNKKEKLGLGYMFLNNLYNVADPSEISDDNVLRLSYFRTVRFK